MDCMGADKRLWEVRLIYFLMFAGLSCFLPYATLYSYHLGLTPSQVGLIWGLEPLVSFLCCPLWGSIADKYSKHKQILMTCIICSSALWLSLLFIPPASISNKLPVGIDVGNCTAPSSLDLNSCPLPKIEPSSADNCVTICRSNTEMNNLTSSLVCVYESGLDNCDICLVDDADLQNYSETESNDTVVVPSSSSLRLICDNWSNGSCDTLQCCNCQEDKGTDSGSLLLTFSLCICLVLAGTVFQSVTMPLVDALCFGILAEKGGDYGRQRLWGAIGWGIFAFLSGIAVDEFNKMLNSDRTRYDPIFYMFVGFAALTFFSIAFIRFPPHKSAERVRKNLWLVFQKSYIVAYFILVSVMGMGFGISGAYLFLFMDELNSSYLIMGLSQMITTLAEIPCFFVSGLIIKRIGHNGVFCLGFLAYFVRLLGYSFAPMPWAILPFQVLHGITFGLFWAAATSYATLIAPKGMVATLQTICTGLHFGIGRGVGIAIGGLIYEEFGSRNLFRAFAGLNLVSFVLYYLFLCCMGIELTKPPSDDKDTNQMNGKTEKTANDDPEADVAFQMKAKNANHTASADQEGSVVS